LAWSPEFAGERANGGTIAYDCGLPPTRENIDVHVLSAASEFFPLVKTGGLGDVVGALPKALTEFGIKTTTILPGYRSVLEALTGLQKIADINLLGEQAEICAAVHDGQSILVVVCAALYDRAGGPYLGEDGTDYPDNWKRFAAFSLATAMVAAGETGASAPDILHLHDWHTGLAAPYSKRMNPTLPVVMTIHNLAFQGQFSAQIFGDLGLPTSYFSSQALEYYGGISFLKAGIIFADAITTVSPTYAREILVDGMGMEGVLLERRDSLRGIVNGIDMDVWNPMTDTYIAANYDAGSIKRRAINKADIENRFGLSNDSGALISVVSRLTWQKGIDLLAPILPGIVDRGAKLVVCGQGDAALINPLIHAASRYAGKVAVFVGFSEDNAHLLHAGSDIVLQPSRFEPCGLSQLYALRYGAVPIVARTGGLAETIIDANEAAAGARVATGFHFQPGSVEDLYHAIDRALIAYEQPEFWGSLQSRGMKADFSWRRSAGEYSRLYAELLQSDEGQEAFSESI
jgi:starch synthase